MLKKILTISFPFFVLFFGMSEWYARQHCECNNLPELTGKALTNNPMSYWAFNDPFCAYSPKPGTYSGGKTVNGLGFISTPEIKDRKPDSTIRIVYLGGSSAAGTGVVLKDEETWPWKVNEILKKSGYKVDFINGAVGGYTSFESYGLLFSRIRFFNPDIVVVYHGWNDSYYFSTTSGEMYKWRENDDGSYSINFKTYYESFSPHWIDPFVQWSCLLTEFRLKFIHRQGRGELFSQEEMEQTAEGKFDKTRVRVFRENLLLIKALCELRGIRLFVCKQASLLPLLATERDKFHFEGQGFDMTGYKEAFDSIYAVIDSAFKRPEIIDLSSVSYDSGNFYDQIHPSEKGTTAIARIVSDSIIHNFFKK